MIRRDDGAGVGLPEPSGSVTRRGRGAVRAAVALAMGMVAAFAPFARPTSATSAALSRSGADRMLGQRGGGTDVPRETEGTLVARIRLSASARRAMRALGIEGPIRGRLFILASRDGSRDPREQVDVSGIPFWGMDVGDIGDEPVTMNLASALVRGYPFASPTSLPSGEYRLQAFLNVYSRYTRSDGHVLWLHHDRGEGQDLWKSPGNAYSEVGSSVLDPAHARQLEFVLDRVIPAVEPVPPGGVLDQGNPVDSAHVKFVKMRSQRLSRFWGRPMYLGANVLLPRDYARSGSVRYPTIYLQGHFPGRAAPFGFQEPGAVLPARQGAHASVRAFSDFWLSETAPRVVVVTVRDANPYYDTSYAVDSANVGPYGEAITQELLPYLEQEFRLIREPWARVLAGGSTGGWEALALQLFYPHLFGGAWSWCPDSVDFRHHQAVNIYEDLNAYVAGTDNALDERPSMRGPDGRVVVTMRQENAFEAALGPRNRSGGQWAIWEAVFGPTGEDGYPQPLWDPDTGAIDKTVAAEWRQRFDLSDYVRREWPRLAPYLAGRIHVAVGEMDSYFLERGVHAFDERLRTLSPPPRVSFEYGPGKPHCWTGASRTTPGADLANGEFVVRAADYMARLAPGGTSRHWRGRQP